VGIFSLPGLLRRILLCADFRSLVVGFSRRVLSLRGFGFSVVFGFPAVFGSLRGFRFFVVFGSPVSRVLSVGSVLSVWFCSAVSVFVDFVCVRHFALRGLCVLVGFVWASAASFGLLVLRVSFYCLVWASTAWCGLLLHRVCFFCFVFASAALYGLAGVSQRHQHREPSQSAIRGALEGAWQVAF